jgi:RNA polymerase sigma-70 factor (ECF subfamily)
MPGAESSLLGRVAEGNLGDALESLYDRYARRVYGLGLRLLGDTSLAEEMVQETFVRLWRNAARYDPERGAEATFVFTIARRVAVDLWRRPSSRPLEGQDEIEEKASPEGDAAERVTLQLTVREALDSLSAEQREVLELLHLQDLTQAQAAERLGVPLGTVKTRAFYGLRALRKHMEDRRVDA